MVSAGEFVRITAGPYAEMSGVYIGSAPLSWLFTPPDELGEWALVRLTSTGREVSVRLEHIRAERRTSEILNRLRERARHEGRVGT